MPRTTRRAAPPAPESGDVWCASFDAERELRRVIKAEKQRAADAARRALEAVHHAQDPPEEPPAAAPEAEAEPEPEPPALEPEPIQQVVEATEVEEEPHEEDPVLLVPQDASTRPATPQEHSDDEAAAPAAATLAAVVVIAPAAAALAPAPPSGAPLTGKAKYEYTSTFVVQQFTAGQNVHAIAKTIEFKQRYCGPSGKMCSSMPYSIVLQILAEQGVNKDLVLKRLKDAGVTATYPYKQLEKFYARKR